MVAQTTEVPTQTSTAEKLRQKAAPPPQAKSAPKVKAGKAKAGKAKAGKAKAGKGPKKQRQVTADFKTKKMTALDAAAKVLAESGQPMSSPELIEAMAAKQYWTSPAGKTPAATLYAAILREIKVKKGEARFVKTERGKFGLRAPKG